MRLGDNLDLTAHCRNAGDQAGDHGAHQGFFTGADLATQDNLAVFLHAAQTLHSGDPLNRRLDLVAKITLGGGIGNHSGARCE